MPVGPPHVSLPARQQAGDGRLGHPGHAGDLSLCETGGDKVIDDVLPVHDDTYRFSNNNAYRQTDCQCYQNTDMNTFGERLRETRKRLKLSQKEVAQRVGMSQPLLSELENDEYPTSGFTTKLAFLYKVNARWLAEGKGPRDASAVELFDDERAAKLWERYLALDEAGRALIDYLLAPESKPEWLSDGAAALIENAKVLVTEQIPK